MNFKIYSMTLGGKAWSNTFLVACLIKKWPPLWSKYARKLKQKYDDYTSDELLVSLNIEEKHREKQVEIPDLEVRAKALVVENPHKPKHQSFNSTKKFVSHNNNNNKPKGKILFRER